MKCTKVFSLQISNFFVSNVFSGSMNIVEETEKNSKQKGRGESQEKGMSVKTIQISWHSREPIFSVDFHPSSRTIATAGADNDIKVFL